MKKVSILLTGLALLTVAALAGSFDPPVYGSVAGTSVTWTNASNVRFTLAGAILSQASGTNVLSIYLVGNGSTNLIAGPGLDKQSLVYDGNGGLAVDPSGKLIFTGAVSNTLYYSLFLRR